MPYPHPQFANLVVYEDTPHAGAFYQVTSKDSSLSRLAKKAYGNGTRHWWGLINKSKYNSKFVRRAESGACKSPKVAYPQGYIAMCRPYPLLWIPSREGEEPHEVSVAIPSAPEPVTEEVSRLGMPNATMHRLPLPSSVLNAYSPQRTAMAARAALSTKMSEAMVQGVEGPPQIPQDLARAGMPQWLGSFLLVAGVGIAGVVFAVKAGA